MAKLTFGWGMFRQLFDWTDPDNVQIKADYLANAADAVVTVSPAVTAHAGGGQGSAVAITADFTNITVCATEGDSVKLPTATVGKTFTVRNNGVASADVFPYSGDTINGGSANAAIKLPIGATIEFVAINSTDWKATNSVHLQNTLATAASGSLTAITTSALTTGNVVSTTVSQTLTAASSTNTTEVSQFILTSNVQIGNWANAVLAKVDLSATGFVTGLVGVVCAELDMPTTAPAGGAGTYTCFEAEINMAGTSSVPISVINANIWGAQAATFDSNGYLLDITGVTKGSGNVFQDNTATAASQALRVRVNGTPYFIMLTATGA